MNRHSTGSLVNIHTDSVIVAVIYGMAAIILAAIACVFCVIALPFFLVFMVVASIAAGIVVAVLAIFGSLSKYWNKAVEWLREKARTKEERDEAD